MQITNNVLKDLKKKIPYMWKVQTANEYGATCVAYVDARSIQNLLDEVVGPSNWQTHYDVINENLYCSLGIRITHDDGTTEWVYKQDVGTEANTEAEKSECSDSLKRAAVAWGAGRFLYDLEIQKLKTKKHTNNKLYPVDNKGNILWGGDDLTNFLNKNEKIPPSSLEETTPVPVPAKYAKPEETPVYNNKEIPWSKEVQQKASKIEKNGKKGKFCLMEFITLYNKEKNTKLEKISDFNTDEKLLDLIKFVENSVPEKLN